MLVTAPFKRWRQLWLTSIFRQLRQQFLGTSGGWLWVYARPLSLVAAYLMLFSIIFPNRQAPPGVDGNLALFLLTGLLPWLSFADGFRATTNSFSANATILKRSGLPPALFAATATTVSAATMIPIFLILMGYIFIENGAHLGMLWALLWFFAQLLLAYSLGIIGAVLSTALKDIGHIIGIYTAVGLFLAPIFYPLEAAPGPIAFLLWANPITPWITAHRAALLGHSLPDTTTLIAMAMWLSGSLMVAELLLRRAKDRLVDWL